MLALAEAEADGGAEDKADGKADDEGDAFCALTATGQKITTINRALKPPGSQAISAFCGFRAVFLAALLAALLAAFMVALMALLPVRNFARR